jgi:hypothetical protein
LKNLKDKKVFKLHTSQVSFKKPWMFLGIGSIVGVDLLKNNHKVEGKGD